MDDNVWVYYFMASHIKVGSVFNSLGIKAAAGLKEHSTSAASFFFFLNN